MLHSSLPLLRGKLFYSDTALSPNTLRFLTAATGMAIRQFDVLFDLFALPNVQINILRLLN